MEIIAKFSYSLCVLLFALTYAISSSNPNHTPHTTHYRYQFQSKTIMTEALLGQNKPRMVYWSLANCGIDDTYTALTAGKLNVSAPLGSDTLQPYYCRLGPNTPYCSGAIDVYMQAHFFQEYSNIPDSSPNLYKGVVVERGFHIMGLQKACLVYFLLYILVIVPLATLVWMALQHKNRMHKTVWLLFIGIALTIVRYVISDFRGLI